jgi:hypothetical protein
MQSTILIRNKEQTLLCQHNYYYWSLLHLSSCRVIECLFNKAWRFALLKVQGIAPGRLSPGLNCFKRQKETFKCTNSNHIHNKRILISQWTIDTEVDYQRALQAVSAGKVVHLTVTNAVSTPTNDYSMDEPPKWFSDYMKKVSEKV